MYFLEHSVRKYKINLLKNILLRKYDKLNLY